MKEFVRLHAKPLLGVALLGFQSMALIAYLAPRPDRDPLRRISPAMIR